MEHHRVLPLAHQIWGGDGALLHSIGAIDFAGGIVVHVSSGVSGIVAATMLGKRIGYPRIPKAPHSLVLTNIGGGLLWVGWFGFNAGSATAANYVAGQAMLVTQIASAAGAIGWTVAERSSYGRPSSLGMISGAISGLVSITPAAGSVGAMASMCIGAVAGILCFYSCTAAKEALGWYDDALDVFGIHGVGGIVGAILVSFWASPLAGGNGFGTIVLRGGETHPIREVGTQLGVQLCSIAYAVVWATLGTILVLKTVDACHGDTTGASSGSSTCAARRRRKRTDWTIPTSPSAGTTSSSTSRKSPSRWDRSDRSRDTACSSTTPTTRGLATQSRSTKKTSTPTRKNKPPNASRNAPNTDRARP